MKRKNAKHHRNIFIGVHRYASEKTITTKEFVSTLSIT